MFDGNIVYQISDAQRRKWIHSNIILQRKKVNLPVTVESMPAGIDHIRDHLINKLFITIR